MPLLALIAGIIAAFIAAGVQSLFFVLLPLLAFAFGYCSSWRWGLVCGVLLFVSYTFAMSVFWWGLDSPNLLYPFPYIAAFIAGGFSLLIIGSLAPLVRKGVRKAGSISVLVVLALVVGWCGYTALPQYGYYYQVAVQASQPMGNIELYLPLGTVSGEPYAKLYRETFKMPGGLPSSGLTEEFTREIVDTERGKMLKITIPELQKDNVPVPRYTANIIFGRAGLWQKSEPYQIIHLMPKSDVVELNTMSSQESVGPVKTREFKDIESFNVPVKIAADTPALVKLTMWNRTDRGEALNFTYTYGKSYPYTERLSYDLLADGQWKSVPVAATSAFEIRGVGD